MMTLKSTKKTTDTKQSCEFCNRLFSRSSTLLTHICEPKRRWQERDKKGNIIGLSSWIQFYGKHGKKKKDYDDFIKSPYYTAFVKFGNYCADAQVFNVPRYVDWLLKQKISIDSWNRDTHYTKFILEYIQTEDPLDAIGRSIETLISIAEKDKIQNKDAFRYGNKNRICFEITKAHISPWVIYQSQSGIEFVENLDSTQQKMIFEYINPEIWAIIFLKHKDKVQEVKELLRVGGY